MSSFDFVDNLQHVLNHLEEPSKKKFSSSADADTDDKEQESESLIPSESDVEDYAELGPIGDLNNDAKVRDILTNLTSYVDDLLSLFNSPQKGGAEVKKDFNSIASHIKENLSTALSLLAGDNLTESESSVPSKSAEDPKAVQEVIQHLGTAYKILQRAEIPGFDSKKMAQVLSAVGAELDRYLNEQPAKHYKGSILETATFFTFPDKEIWEKFKEELEAKRDAGKLSEDQEKQLESVTRMLAEWPEDTRVGGDKIDSESDEGDPEVEKEDGEEDSEPETVEKELQDVEEDLDHLAHEKTEIEQALSPEALQTVVETEEGEGPETVKDELGEMQENIDHARKEVDEISDVLPDESLELEIESALKPKAGIAEDIRAMGEEGRRGMDRIIEGLKEVLQAEHKPLSQEEWVGYGIPVGAPSKLGGGAHLFKIPAGEFVVHFNILAGFSGGFSIWVSRSISGERINTIKGIVRQVGGSNAIEVHSLKETDSSSSIGSKSANCQCGKCGCALTTEENKKKGMCPGCCASKDIGEEDEEVDSESCGVKTKSDDAEEELESDPEEMIDVDLEEPTELTTEQSFEVTEQLANELLEALEMSGELDEDEFERGLEVEQEHGTVKDPALNVTDDDPEETAKIAAVHLEEDPEYYTKLDSLNL